MAHNHPQRLRVATQHLRRARRSILMTDAVKTVPANTLLHPCIGSRVNVRGGLQRGMESGIETRNLWDASAQDMIDRFDRFQLEAIVRGRKLNLLSNRAADVRRQRSTLTILGPAMHNAMAHHIDIRRPPNHLRVALPKQFKHWLQHRNRRVNLQLAMRRSTIGPFNLNFGDAGEMAPIGMRAPMRLLRRCWKRTIRKIREPALQAAGDAR